MHGFKEEQQDHYKFQVYHIAEQEEMDTVTYGMITNNKIEGIIDCSYVQIDEDKMFRFNVSDLVSFRDYFQREIKKKELLNICYSLAIVVQELNSYMIDSNRMILDRDYMYINVRTNQTNIIVLPIETDKDSGNLHGFLKELLFEVEIDQNEDITYFATLIKLLGSNFHLDEFIRKLDELKSSEQIIKKKEPVEINHMETKTSVVQEERVVIRETKMPQQEPLEKLIQDDVKTPEFEMPIQEKKAVIERKKGLFGSLFKKEEKTKSKSKKEKRTKEAGFAKHKNTDFIIPGQEPTTLNKSHEQIPFPESTKSTDSGHIIGTASQHQIRRTDRNFGETVVLEEESETTLLAEDVEDNSYPYLINKKNLEKIEIKNAYFRIGKSSDNDYVVQGNNTVSKYHAWIETKEGQCYIVDNNSKNHTYIDNQKLTAQTKYPLYDGNILKISNEVFEFHW